MTNLRGQTIVITGASSGIGAEAARKVARLGATVCLLARREDELDDVRTSIEAAGGTAYAYAVDLSDADATDDVAAQLLAEHPADRRVGQQRRPIDPPADQGVARARCTTTSARWRSTTSVPYA